jgi:hypothetical protein
MNNEIITKTKWFWTWQDEKEEAWLSEMANQGLHLADVPFPGSYHFRKGEPANYVYRLDYQSLRTKDKDSYLQLFADVGWENVGEMGGWVYFRYKVTNGEAPEIYSDLKSKIGKYQRVMLYLVIILPIMLLLMNNLSAIDSPGPFFMILEGLSALLMLLYAFGMIQLFIRINKLKKTN